MKRSVTTHTKPKTLFHAGANMWIYNFDIRQEAPYEVKGKDEEGNEVIKETYDVYSCVCIKFNGKPDYKRCVEEVIRAHISQSEEFDIINSFNRAQLSLMSTEDEAIEAANDYQEYLQLLASIKEKVKKDFE